MRVQTSHSQPSVNNSKLHTEKKNTGKMHPADIFPFCHYLEIFVNGKTGSRTPWYSRTFQPCSLYQLRHSDHLFPIVLFFILSVQESSHQHSSEVRSSASLRTPVKRRPAQHFKARCWPVCQGSSARC